MDDPSYTDIVKATVLATLLLIGVISVTSTVFFDLDMRFWERRTQIERKVFENSYQRSEGLKAKIAMLEAQKADASSSASPTTRTPGTPG